MLLIAARVLAQPLITPGGVVNAASYNTSNTSASSGGGIAQGSIFSIFGTGLGPPAPGAEASRFPLETSLGGVQVRLSTGSGLNLPSAIPLFVSASQINAILPSTTPVGLVLVSVGYNGRTSPSEAVKVVRSSFGIFTHNSAGAGPAIVQNFVPGAGLPPLNSTSTAATPGQTVILWGTGLGPITGADNVVPTPASGGEPLELTLAGRPVVVDYQGRSGCCAGADQINFRVPAEAPTGCAVPLSVKVQNGVYSNIAVLAIAQEPGPCRDPLNALGGTGRWGQVSLSRTLLEAVGPGPPATMDEAEAVFGQAPPPARYPPPGFCGSAAPVTAATLAAGPELMLAGPQGNRSVPRDGLGRYVLNSPSGGPLFLGPGPYVISGSGGSDVGPFRASLTAGPPLNWNLTAGDRSTGITLRWSGGAGSEIVVISGSRFLCTASVAAGSFTLGPAMLANLPAADGILSVGSVAQTAFTASGLDGGALTYTQATSRRSFFGEPALAASPVRLPNGRMILAELAITGAEQQRGLMQRPALDPDRGMLFLYDRPQSLSFWMYRTLIPLDILWTDQNRRVLFISANTPPCRSEDSRQCPTYGPREAAQYVLELAAGVAADQGLRVGDRLDW